MRYYKSDFAHENAFLRRSPENATEAYNKLLCLFELDKRRNPKAGLYTVGLSDHRNKRRNRLVKQYWAFRRMGERV